MSLPDIETALAIMLADVVAMDDEMVALEAADGRVLAADLTADRDQPPFDASVMDGWAVHEDDLAGTGGPLLIVGESAAGGRCATPLKPGQTVRVFTGAPLPPGTGAVVMQEQARREGGRLTLHTERASDRFIRPRGGDFSASQVLLKAGQRLDPWSMALAASGGQGRVAVKRRPRVAILITGDEIVTGGGSVEDHQIHDAVGPALSALIRRWGGEPLRLVPAGDSEAAILASLGAEAFDLLVTVGGASVGDHDRVKPALKSRGLSLTVEGVAVKPGKPTWFGTLADRVPVLGLPGNPASALVCAELFLKPLVARMQGMAWEASWAKARLETALGANGPREQLLRATSRRDEEQRLVVAALPRQDSSLVSILSVADVLIRRPPSAPQVEAGAMVSVLRLDRAG